MPGLLTLVYAPNQPPLTVGARELLAALGRGELLVMVGHTLAHVLGGPGAGWAACPHRLDPLPSAASGSGALGPDRRSLAFKLRADPDATFVLWPLPSAAAFASVSQLLDDFRANHPSILAPGYSPPAFKVQVTWTETGDGSGQTAEAAAAGRGSFKFPGRSNLLEITVRPDTPVLSLRRRIARSAGVYARRLRLWRLRRPRDPSGSELALTAADGSPLSLAGAGLRL